MIQYPPYLPQLRGIVKSLITGVLFFLLSTTLLVGQSVTDTSQDSLVLLSPNDILFLKDEVLSEIAWKLEDRQILIEKDSVCTVENKHLNAQLLLQDANILLYKGEIKILNSQLEDFTALLQVKDDRIALRDKEIIKLKTTRWIIIGVSGAVVVGTIVIATQIK